MEDAFRQAFVGQARKQLRIDRAVLERLAAEPGAIPEALVREGHADAAGVRTVYQGVRDRLLARNVQHHRDAADRALLRLAVRANVVSGEAASAALQRWNELPAYARARLADALVETNVLSSEERARLAGRLEAEHVACAICGFHLDRLAIEPGMCCSRCGWPELVDERTTAQVSSNTWTGRLVSGWTLVERIGQGGTGRVFYARHAVHGEGAFKVLNPQAASDPKWLARFEREARAAGAIDHPGAVRILDVGQDEELPYLVMEWVDGESLARRIERAGPLESTHAVQIARRLAGALAAAHATGVIHRDIKPANVLLDRDQRAKLADFGLARGVVDTSVSQVGAVIGSPGYMSPEQVRGETLDYRSDVFNLGLLIHAMLTGRSPLARNNTMESMRATINERVPPLSRSVPTVPPLLDALVLEMTSRDLTRRTPSMARVLTGLERIAGDASFDDGTPGAAGAVGAGALADPPEAPPAGHEPDARDPALAAPRLRRRVPRVVNAFPDMVTSVRAALNGPLGLMALIGLAVITGLMLRSIWPRGEAAVVLPADAGPRVPVIARGGPATGTGLVGVSFDERRGAEAELARCWTELVDDVATPTGVRHAQWCEREAAAGPALAALMAERRGRWLVALQLQARTESATILPVLKAAVNGGNWDEARLQADRLPTWAPELAATRARWVESIDDRRYLAALEQVAALVRAEPDRASAASAILNQHPVLAKRHAGQRATNPVARWVDHLSRVAAAAQAHVDGLQLPCVVAVERADGTTIELELERVEVPRGEPTWGRELGGVVGGTEVALRWADFSRAQKARWAFAGLSTANLPPAERRSLVETYLTAGGVAVTEIAAVIRELER